MSNKFEGKVVLVTGGSRGIGAAVVRRFVAERATVVFTYNNAKEQAEKLQDEMKGLAVAHKTDQGSEEQCLELIDFVVKTYGKIDVLVNNAGISFRGMIGEGTSQDFDRVFNTNVRGVWVTTNAAIKHIPENGGRIINIGSIRGERAMDPNCGFYVGSKFAVNGFTRAWAKDLGPRGITVNCVQPGPIDTDMNPDVETNPNQALYRKSAGLKRYGTAEEVAQAVYFLATPEASYVSGSILNVDGAFVC
jgi:3-oxoacyl-[acyl-carrier protein] reductase